jgi:hypothetical protein
VTAPTLEPPAADPHPRRGLRWWREVLYILAFYALYTLVRDLRGEKPVSRLRAYSNAQRVIGAERFVGAFQEGRIQSWFLPWHAVVRILDDFYGTAHFVVTLVALVFLFRSRPGRYPLWRNTLALTTALALAGFAFFPLMPPRLLPTGFHFVDTLQTVGGLWSFDSGPMHSVSNQYAAMPSLHFAWSVWCALALAPALTSVAGRSMVGKVLIWCYPLATLLCIVVTGNHYFLDAVGGGVTLAIGFWLARIVQQKTTERSHA